MSSQDPPKQLYINETLLKQQPPPHQNLHKQHHMSQPIQSYISDEIQIDQQDKKDSKGQQKHQSLSFSRLWQYWQQFKGFFASQKPIKKQYIKYGGEIFEGEQEEDPEEVYQELKPSFSEQTRKSVVGIENKLISLNEIGMHNNDLFAKLRTVEDEEEEEKILDELIEATKMMKMKAYAFGKALNEENQWLDGVLMNLNHQIDKAMVQRESQIKKMLNRSSEIDL